jgi:heat shock protein HtpX
VLTRQGVEVDHCDTCEGVWLDRGELFLFARKPKRVSQRLDQALTAQRPTDRRSPPTGEPMVEITWPDGPHIDYCPRSGGLWFGASELKALLETESGVRLALDPKGGAARPSVIPVTEGKDDREARRHDAIAAGRLPLPNLVLRSTATLVGLYALLGAALIAAVEFGGLDLEFAVWAGVAIVVLQFLIGPFLMDMSLRWLYRMDWVAPEQLPEHLRRFVERLCGEQEIRVPRFGIINDGAPQAFTYGHTPNNARVVISRGILELLDADEVEAVVAHEIGHAVHWDMFLMTVVQLVPLLFYYVYRTLIRMRIKGRDKTAGARIAIAIGAYVLYIISEYVVLWFSRTREYHADRFAGEVTRNPASLASARVKIAYGLAGQRKAKGSEAAESRSHNLAALGAMGIFDAGAAQALAITSYSATAAAAADGAVDKGNLKGAMRWDLWNPWAKWYELNSTHPLVANRLRYLSDQAVHMGHEPYVVFDEAQPESYWDEFFADLGIHLLPAAAVIAVALFALAQYAFEILPAGGELYLPLSVALLGGALWLKFAFAYRSDFFSPMSVAALLKKVKVSAVRPVPCRLNGTVIGRGVPGYIFSEDFVMRDDTGIIFLDFRQPLAIWEWLFGLLKAGGYQGREVVVEGWYRRAPVPYIELRSIEMDGDVTRSWVPLMNKLVAIAVIAIGAAWAGYVALGI